MKDDLAWQVYASRVINRVRLKFIKKLKEEETKMKRDKAIEELKDGLDTINRRLEFFQAKLKQVDAESKPVDDWPDNTTINNISFEKYESQEQPGEIMVTIAGWRFKRGHFDEIIKYFQAAIRAIDGKVGWPKSEEMEHQEGIVFYESNTCAITLGGKRVVYISPENWRRLSEILAQAADMWEKEKC